MRGHQTKTKAQRVADAARTAADAISEMGYDSRPLWRHLREQIDEALALPDDPAPQPTDTERAMRAPAWGAGLRELEKFVEGVRMPARRRQFHMWEQGWQDALLAVHNEIGRLIAAAPDQADPAPQPTPTERDAIKFLTEQKDGAYRERDCLVCALSKCFPSFLARHSDSDTEWDDDWRWIVFVDLPTGQATWHIHDSERAWFNHLPVRDNAWDGHSTDEKYQRLAALRAAQPGGDAKLRELRARLVSACRIKDRGYDACDAASPLWTLDEIDRLLAAAPDQADAGKVEPAPFVEDGRRDYKFRLAPSLTDRCHDCEYSIPMVRDIRSLRARVAELEAQAAKPCPDCQSKGGA